jgi:hypothetical protein
MIESGRSGQWCADSREKRTIRVSPPKRRKQPKNTIARMGKRTPATYWYALLLLLLITPAAWSQDVFMGQGAPDYEDQFSGNCHSANPPNIFAQLGMNPMACRGEVAPADSRRQCSLRGMTLLKQVGNTCYYCSPLKPPINGIIVAYDQVGNATHQGFQCGVNQIDPNCSAICSKPSGSTEYTPPRGGKQAGTPGTLSGGTNGPCEDYTGLDMNTPEGRATAYQRCSDALCQHNPSLQRCQGSAAQPAPVTPQPFVSCTIKVAFEQVGVVTLVRITNGFHAVILLEGGGLPLTGYEGNPSGNPQNWGTLIARERNMTRHPLKGLYGDNGEPVMAGLLLESCTTVAARMRGLVQQLNAAHMLYAPIPELQWNTVNSNSFAYWALGQLGVHQPAAPTGTQAYGYNADIR